MTKSLPRQANLILFACTNDKILLGTSKFDSICLFLVQMTKSSLGHANLILFACPNNKILFGTSKFDQFCLSKWQNPPLRQANLTVFVCPSAKFYLVCCACPNDKKLILSKIFKIDCKMSQVHQNEKFPILNGQKSPIHQEKSKM